MAIKKKYDVVDETEEIVEEVKEEKQIGGYVTTDSVNFRVGPSKETLVIAVLGAGTPVDVLEFEGEWAQILYNKTLGYVMAEYIKAI